MKPTIVLGGLSEHEPAKGSGRSTPGVNLGAAVAKAKMAGLLINGGGHAAAAGLTLEWDRVEALKDFLSDALKDEIEAAAGEARALSIDAAGAVAAIDLDLVDAVERIGPYGQGHPEPVFALSDVRVFKKAEGLSWLDPAGRTFTLPYSELQEWIGERAQAGRLAPRGFPKSNKFGRSF